MELVGVILGVVTS